MIERTHCKWGHPWINLKQAKGHTPWCRTCAIHSSRRHRYKNGANPKPDMQTRTHCVNGHTWINPYRGIQCRICRSISAKKHVEALKMLGYR